MQLTQEQIAQIKQEWESTSTAPIYKVSLLDNDYIFTAAERKVIFEVEDMMGKNPNIRQIQIDEFMVQKTLIYPKWTPTEYSALPAGVIPTLAMHIRDKSGFYVPDFSDPSMLYAESITEETPIAIPSNEEIAELKEKYKWNLYGVRCVDGYFVFRPVSRLEWRNINDKSEDPEIDICKTCVIWPKKQDWDKTLAGTTRNILNAVMEKSGFTVVPPQAEKL